MNCPRCNEPIEPAAAFCGNCGQPLRPANTPAANANLGAAAVSPPPPAAGVELSPVPQPPIPGYALANPAEHKSDGKVMGGLILAVLSIPGGLIPVIGVLLAVIGLIMAAPGRKLPHKKTMTNAAIACAVLGIVVSVAAYAYNYNHLKKPAANTSATANDQSATKSDGNSADTPCYSTTIPAVKHVDMASDSCALKAYEASSLDTSDNAYSIEAVAKKELTAANIASDGKNIVLKYVSDALPAYTVSSQRSGTFAGSPAYYVDAKGSQGVTIEIAMVVHAAAHGENVFILTHAINGQADLSQIEKDWQWK